MAQSPEGIDFRLDRDSDLPLGAQLAWRLRSLIANGRLGVGERLPGVREMATLAGVNVNTVRSVYGRLADQGAIVSEHGRGTFVADPRAAAAELERMAATLAPSDQARTAPAERADAGASHEGRRRASLRAEIAMLERELAALEVPVNGETKPAGDRRNRPTPQLLTAADLEAIRDELVERLQPLRADRMVARHELESERHTGAQAELARRPAAKQRAIATTRPKFETGAGGWSLRWRG